MHSAKARRQTLILRQSLRSVRWYRRCRTVFQKKSASAYRKSKTENQKEMCIRDRGLTAQGIEIVRRKSENKLRQTLARIEEIAKEYLSLIHI